MSSTALQSVNGVNGAADSEEKLSLRSFDKCVSWKSVENTRKIIINCWLSIGKFSVTIKQYRILRYDTSQIVHENSQTCLHETIQDSGSPPTLLAGATTRVAEIRQNSAFQKLIQQPGLSGGKERWDSMSSSRLLVFELEYLCG
jgi:hypothetical protein